MAHVTTQDLQKILGTRYKEVNGQLIHVSRLGDTPTNILNNTKTPSEAHNHPILGPEPEPAPKAKSDHPEINALYDRAYAALVILNYNTPSTNRLKWKHWSLHHKERKKAGKTLELRGFWKIPFNGSAPQPLTKPKHLEIAFIRYGGRTLDYGNLVDGCKSLLDHLKNPLKLIHDDAPKWLRQHYHQIPGGFKKTEILFLKPTIHP
jgi:hypothetical protein